MTLREYIAFWQKTYDKHQSRPTTYAAHNYVFQNQMRNIFKKITIKKTCICCSTRLCYFDERLNFII